MDSQQFESYVPLYDVMPEKWDEAREVIVEQFKKISEGINIREIGWYLDEELLTGKNFIPGVIIPQDGGDSQQFRSILRKVVIFPVINAGANQQAHGVTFDANFTLVELWGSATNISPAKAATFSTVATCYMDSTNVYIVADQGYDRGLAVIEYMQEL